MSLVKEFRHGRSGLKLPAAICRESSILRVVLFILIARSWINFLIKADKIKSKTFALRVNCLSRNDPPLSDSYPI
jgi:hypothetical protein